MSARTSANAEATDAAPSTPEWTGFAVGVFRLVIEFLNNNGSLAISDNSFLGQFISVNFLHFALYLFVFCTAILMLVSKMGQPQPAASLELVTFQKKTTKEPFKFTIDVKLTIALVMLVLFIWWLFSPLGLA